MRLMTSRHADITVVGSVRAIAIGAGAVVDVDQVVGEGTTLADALGPALLQGFTAVQTSAQVPADADVDGQE